MEVWREAVGECSDRCRGSETLYFDTVRPFVQWPPSIESEALQMVARDETWLTSPEIEDDRSRRQRVDPARPENPIVSPNEAASVPVSLSADHSVELRSSHEVFRRSRCRDRSLNVEVVGPSA